MESRLSKIVGAVAAAAIAVLVPQVEGNKQIPYKDVGGTLTVCAGVTNIPIIPHHRYTKEECDAINDVAEAEHAKAFMSLLSPLTKAVITPEVITAGVLFTYNVGPGAAKKSSFVRLLNEGKTQEACNSLRLYKYVFKKKNGKVIKLDCSIRKNDCYGVYVRHNMEADICSGKQTMQEVINGKHN